MLRMRLHREVWLTLLQHEMLLRRCLMPIMMFIRHDMSLYNIVAAVARREDITAMPLPSALSAIRRGLMPLMPLPADAAMMPPYAAFDYALDYAAASRRYACRHTPYWRCQLLLLFTAIFCCYRYAAI